MLFRCPAASNDVVAERAGFIKFLRGIFISALSQASDATRDDANQNHCEN